MRIIRAGLRRSAAGLALTAAVIPLFLLNGGPAAGQQETAPETREPGDVRAVQLTAEAIQDMLKQIQEASDLDDAAKSKLVDIYKQALQELAKAAKLAAQAAQFEKETEQAPQLLETIKAERDKPQPAARPDIPDGATLAQLEQLHGQANAELASAKEKLAKLDSEPERRMARRTEIPARVAAVKQELEELTPQLEATPSPEVAPELIQAESTLLLARKKVLEQEIDACNKELASYDASKELLAVRTSQAARQLASAQALLNAWEVVVSEARRAEAGRAAAEARRAVLRAHPALRQLAEENTKLTDSLKALGPKMDQASQELAQYTKEVDGLKAELDRLEQREKTAGGLTKALGILLRRKRAELPDIRLHRRDIRLRQSEITSVQTALIDYEEERGALVSISAKTEEILASLDPSLGRVQPAEVEGLLEKKREYLKALIDSHNSYLVKLVDLDAKESELISWIRKLKGHIDERILYTRSTHPLRAADIAGAWQALSWFISPREWAGVGGSCWSDLRAHPVTYALAVLVFVLLGLFRGRLGGLLERLGERTHSARSDRFSLTIAAFILTGLIAVFFPALCWFVGWRLWAPAEAPEFAKAIGYGLQAAAVLYLALALFRAICLPRGLADDHFHWHDEALMVVRRNLSWFMAIALPMVFVVSVLNWTDNEIWKDSLGRMAFVVELLALAALAQLILRPSGVVMKDIVSRHRGGWLDRLRHLWYLLAVVPPLGLAGAAALGYYYTAEQLERRLRSTFLLVIVLVLLYATLTRWLFVVRRRLALKKAERRRAEQAEALKAKGTPDAEAAPVTVEEPPVSLHAIGVQTRKLLQSLVVLAAVIGVWLIWKDVLPALGILEKVRLWQKTTLADLILAILIVIMTIVAARNLPGFLEIVVLQRLPLHHGVRFAITTIARYLITIIGLVIAFQAIGIGWAKVQWLAAAITVGLGFGLQEIFANFVSGLIILFERPMRVGDIVTVGDITGKVSRIRIRATTIINWDRKELIVPNKEFITGRLVNWTLSDTILRIVVPVGIAYGSDTKQARELLLKVAHDNPNVLDDPPPTAVFTGFGESSLDFQLRVFVPNYETYFQTIHDLHMAVDGAFRAAGIEIAFPQLDIRVQSVQGPLGSANKKDKS